MISKKQLVAKLYSIVSTSYSSDQNVSIIQKFLEFCALNYNEFDEEAKRLCNQSLNGILKDIKLSLKTMPNGEEKKKAVREMKKILNEHADSKKLVEALERKSNNNPEFLIDARTFFINKLQILLDILCDATEQKSSGVADFSKLQLFYSCVYELVASFHLAQHCYINQSYTHLRTIIETLDKIKLFHYQSDMAELWASDDPKDRELKREELKPSSVRKKLGNKKGYDPLYSWFSEKGTHSTFNGLQSYSGMEKSSSRDETQIIITLGGSGFKDEAIHLLAFLLHVLVRVISEAINIYTKVLNVNETIKLLKTIGTDLKFYYERHYIDYFIENDDDRTQFAEALSRLNKCIPRVDN